MHCRGGRGRRSAAAATIQSGPRSPPRARVSASALVEGKRVMGRQTITRRHRRGRKPHQNSEWAAALATPTSGPG